MDCIHYTLPRPHFVGIHWYIVVIIVAFFKKLFIQTYLCSLNLSCVDFSSLLLNLYRQDDAVAAAAAGERGEILILKIKDKTDLRHTGNCIPLILLSFSSCSTISIYKIGKYLLAIKFGHNLNIIVINFIHTINQFSFGHFCPFHLKFKILSLIILLHFPNTLKTISIHENEQINIIFINMIAQYLLIENNSLG